MNKKTLGILGEDLAVKYLQKKGYLIKERNFRKSWGEIDIVAYDKKRKEWVFVEVKSSSNDLFLPEEHFTSSKKKNLKKIILTYLSRHQLENQNWRVDIISLIINNKRDKLLKLDHYQNHFLDFIS